MKRKNIISRIIDIWKKGLNFDNLVETNKYLLIENSKLEIFSEDLIEELEEVKAKYDLVRVELKNLLKNKEIDVLNLKKWYDSKYSDVAWEYNFDGKGAKDVKYVLRVSKKGRPALVKLAKKILKKYSPKNPTDVVSSVLKFFNNKKEWKYISDKDLFGKREYWELAEVSVNTRKGDCDDLAILMHVLIVFMLELKGFKEHVWRIKLVAGLLLGYGGHAFNVWLHDDGEWYAVESTYDLKGSFSRTWLKTPVKNNNFYSSFWGFATSKKSSKGRLSSLGSYKKTNNNNDF